MFKFCVFVVLLAVALAAPAPKPNPAPRPQPKPKPTYYATAYTSVGAPVYTYSAGLAAPIVYADDYYDHYYEPVYTAYASAPLVYY